MKDAPLQVTLSLSYSAGLIQPLRWSTNYTSNPQLLCFFSLSEVWQTCISALTLQNNFEGQGMHAVECPRLLKCEILL